MLSQEPCLLINGACSVTPVFPVMLLKEAVNIDEPVHRYELLASEELEEKIRIMEEKRNEEKKTQA